MHCFWTILPLCFQAQAPQAPYAPRIEPASEEASQAMQQFQLLPGFEVSLFAAEPRLAQPVAFDVALDGKRVFVAETFRHHKGVTDIRDHMDWLDDDLACKTVEDRVQMFRKHLGDKFGEYSEHHERVRLLVDADQDGRAEFDFVFADGFNEPAAGIGAGLLATSRGVYFTCIPHVWLLGSGGGHVSTERKALSSGYGVRVALLGHDLHGLIAGFDGKLYFSCGDRGFNVQTKHGLLDHSRTGAVLRCNFDGSDLEVFATGLRNPQELAFDDFGELYTGDNNSDGGDQARFVHVIEGGDSGWRQAYQWINEPNQRGPWNAEEIWKPRRESHPAYTLPPIANVASGPSGFCYQPGTALAGNAQQTFFLCDFRGEASYSGIHAIRLVPKGASFELKDDEWFLKGSLVTDCGFGPDGALWFSDWVHGWNQNGKGRIYRITAQGGPSAEQALVAQLLAEGMTARDIGELRGLLAHADRRVRLEAQSELCARGQAGVDALLGLLRNAGEGQPQQTNSELARLHATWGLLRCAASGHESARAGILGALEDASSKVRAQAARALGDLLVHEARSRLEEMLSDPEDPAKLQAAIALGKLARPESVPALVEMLASFGESDPHLRHGAVSGLVGCAKPRALEALASDARLGVRLGAVVALRRQRAPGLAAFFLDQEPRVAREAITAAYDEELNALLPQLASVTANPEQFQRMEAPAARRLLAACLRLGREEDARAVARVAGDPAMDQKLRIEALAHLRRWLEPPQRDPVTGEWRPMANEWREPSYTRQSMAQIAVELGRLARDPKQAQWSQEWLRWVRESSIPIDASLLQDMARNEELALDVRAAALKNAAAAAGAASDAKGGADAGWVPFARALFHDREPRLRAGALEILLAADPNAALEEVQRTLAGDSVPELRVAFEALTRLASVQADALLVAQLERLERGKLPPEVALDLVLAAKERSKAESSSSSLRERLTAREASHEDQGEMAPYVDGLVGGDAKLGRRLFREKAEITCLRCHAVEEGDASEVGPHLAGVGTRLDRSMLLEAIVDPNRTKAEGWLETMFVLRDESLVAGRVISRDGKGVRLVQSDGKQVELTVEDIESERSGLSSMPDGLAKHLSPLEMRDLIEYLSSLGTKAR